MGESQPRGDRPEANAADQSTDASRDTRRLTVREAAGEIGVSEAAVRNRITRGTLRSERKGATVYVLLEANAVDDLPINRGESTEQPQDKRDNESRLIEVLQEQVQYLRGELDAEREARRRADHIIAALTERIPELEAPPQSAQEAQEAAESASEGESRENDAEERTEPESAASEPRSWWRRLFGR